MTRSSLRVGAAIIAGAGVLAGASIAAAVPSTMPAAAPTGANIGNQLQYQVKSSLLGQTKGGKYFYMSNGGGYVQVGPASYPGYDTVQTVTITPPSGQQIIQGMATVSGGDLGSMIIKGTTTTASKYTINIRFPGSQGTPGKLYFRLQLSN